MTSLFKAIYILDRIGGTWFAYAGEEGESSWEVLRKGDTIKTGSLDTCLKAIREEETP